MCFVAWKDELSVGFVAIDNDHKKMVAFINELYRGVQEGRDEAELVGILDELVDFTREHFGREEKLFAEAGLTSTLAHKKEHDELGAAILKARVDYLSGGAIAPSMELMAYLKGWLLTHFTESDKNDFWCLREMNASQSNKFAKVQNG